MDFFIDGEWDLRRDWRTRRRSVTPRPERSIDTVPVGTAADADRAIRSAARPPSGLWRKVPTARRAALQHAAAAAVREKLRGTCPAAHPGAGPTACRLAGRDRPTADLLDYFAEEGLRVCGEIPMINEPNERVLVVKEPVGVVVAIAPFNYPLTLLTFKLGRGADHRLHRRRQAGLGHPADHLAAGRTVPSKRAFHQGSSTRSPVPAANWAGPWWSTRCPARSPLPAAARRASASLRWRRRPTSGSRWRWVDSRRRSFAATSIWTQPFRRWCGTPTPTAASSATGSTASMPPARSTPSSSTGSPPARRRSGWATASIQHATWGRWSTRKSSAPARSTLPTLLAKGARLAAGGRRAMGADFDQGYFFPPTVLADTSRRDEDHARRDIRPGRRSHAVRRSRRSHRAGQRHTVRSRRLRLQPRRGRGAAHSRGARGRLGVDQRHPPLLQHGAVRGLQGERAGQGEVTARAGRVPGAEDGLPGTWAKRRPPQTELVRPADPCA